MTSVITLLVVASIAFLIIRIGAKALEHTGVSRDAARFQALSAFFGAGFTTGESEIVVSHPVRRRIIRDLIVVGNIGLLTLVGTTAVTFFGGTAKELFRNGGVVLGSLVIMWLLASSRPADRLLDKIIDFSMRRTGAVRALDYERVLRLGLGYVISEVTVEEGSEAAGRTLADLKLRDRGINVLGVLRAGGAYVGSPRGPTKIDVGDLLIVYGEDSIVEALARSGDRPRAPEQSAADAD